MKNLVIALVLLTVACGAAHASDLPLESEPETAQQERDKRKFSLKRAAKFIARKTPRVRYIIGSPFYVTGFVIALTADVVVSGLEAGADQYIYGDPVLNW